MADRYKFRTKNLTNTPWAMDDMVSVRYTRRRRGVAEDVHIREARITEIMPNSIHLYVPEDGSWIEVYRHRLLSIAPLRTSFTGELMVEQPPVTDSDPAPPGVEYLEWLLADLNGREQ